jgi:hypothetical protein
VRVPTVNIVKREASEQKKIIKLIFSPKDHIQLNITIIIINSPSIPLDVLGQPQNSRQLAGMSSLIPSHSHGQGSQGWPWQRPNFSSGGL